MNEWRCYLFGLAESNFSSEKSPAVSLIPSCRPLPVGLMDPRRDRKEACVCVSVCVCACGRVCSPCSFFHTCITALSFSRLPDGRKTFLASSVQSVLDDRFAIM